jgi:hypothetical protein
MGIVNSRLIVDTTLVDTSPGGYPNNPFAPPSGWEGNAEAYVLLMRERFQRDPWLRQRLGMVAFYHRNKRPYQVIGPWREAMVGIIVAVCRRLEQSRVEEGDASDE